MFIRIKLIEMVFTLVEQELANPWTGIPRSNLFIVARDVVLIVHIPVCSIDYFLLEIGDNLSRSKWSRVQIWLTFICDLITPAYSRIEFIEYNFKDSTDVKEPMNINSDLDEIMPSLSWHGTNKDAISKLTSSHRSWSWTRSRCFLIQDSEVRRY